jgi:hypothetical protein
MTQLRLIAISTMQYSRLGLPVRMLTWVRVRERAGVGVGVGVRARGRVRVGVRARVRVRARARGKGAHRVVECDGLVEIAVEPPCTGGGEKLGQRVARRQALVRRWGWGWGWGWG